MIVSKTLVILVFVISRCCQLLAQENSSISGYIVGGLNVSSIKMFPHAMYILFGCPDTGKWLCGGSILNQNVFLTAGHCIATCKMRIQAAAGSERIKKPIWILREIDTYQQHPNYDEELYRHDLALLATRKPFPFGTNIQRVMLVRSIPRDIKVAYVAGWGLVTNDKSKKPPGRLKYVSQTLKSRAVCDKNIGGYLSPGEICAWNSHTHRPDLHDSGSALITRYGLQIGIVSYTFPNRPELIVYTNTSYYYNWIKEESQNLFCVIQRMAPYNDKHENEYYDEDPNAN